jgi:hypothetical protein
MAKTTEMLVKLKKTRKATSMMTSIEHRDVKAAVR